MSRIGISEFRIDPAAADGARRSSCRVSGVGLPDTLWFDATGDAGPLLSDRGNWAAVALLFPAMRMGCDLHVEATMSPQLLDAINHDLQAFLAVFDPTLRRIRVTCASLDGDARSGPLVATGFSAGVDSFTTLARYHLAPIDPSLAISALAIFDVGQFYFDGDPGFTRAVDRCTAFAASRGLRTLFLRSNLDAFYRAKVVGPQNFEKTNTFRNVAAVLALEPGIGRYYLASSFAPREIGVRDTYNPAYLDPILLPLLSTERLRLVSACADLTRLEKTRIVAELADAHPLLEVCTRPWERFNGGPTNCSHCGKCIRTLFTLEAIGRLESFAGVFDLARFRRDRDRSLEEIKKSAAWGSSLDAEVVALLGATDVAPPRRKRWRWFRR